MLCKKEEVGNFYASHFQVKMKKWGVIMVTSILCRLIEKALAAASLNDEAASFDQRYSIGALSYF